MISYSLNSLEVNVRVFLIIFQSYLNVVSRLKRSHNHSYKFSLLKQCCQQTTQISKYHFLTLLITFSYTRLLTHILRSRTIIQLGSPNYYFSYKSKLATFISLLSYEDSGFHVPLVQSYLQTSITNEKHTYRLPYYSTVLGVLLDGIPSLK